MRRLFLFQFSVSVANKPIKKWIKGYGVYRTIDDVKIKQKVRALLEGMSIRSVQRVTGLHQETS